MSTIGRRLRAVGIGVGLLAVVALNIFVVPRVFGAEQPAPAVVAARKAVADLPALATALAITPAHRYTGTFQAAGSSDVYTLDARITAGGTLLGTIQTAGTIGEVLEIGDRTFLRAADGFWLRAGITDERRAVFADRWVLVPPTFLGLDLNATFGPATLSAGITTPVAGARTTVDGTVVQLVTAGDRTFQLSTDQPTRLLGVAAAGYQLKPAALDDNDRVAFFAQLRRTAAELATAADLGSRIVQKGRTVLRECDSDSCTGKIAFINRVAATANHVTPANPVTVTVALTRNGKTAKTCPVVLTLAPGAAKVAVCTAEVKARNFGTWRVTTDGIVTALTEAQVKEISATLESELPA
ncbi:hypothetical protein [Actinoplanes derwentensis]|uniref:Uncharacterized protein n=1 Tax=Actinoplanes derwentensis TaxID=113562 RepID=A0A1H2ARH5_9ACTN|nr:hypothetical protein [Actinoplanes derwentensis]GID84365.1 hypothetical protein Ade03nite_32890 [Actinoplanes derwentensis]SDT48570.1 hypothetical protein SAMN04489716_4044 [Actinoplanes derwentensis]